MEFFSSLTSLHNRVIAQYSWLVLGLILIKHLITRVIAQYSWLVLDLTSHHNRVIAHYSWLVLDLTSHHNRVIAHYSWLVLDFVLTLHLTTTELLPIIAGLSLTLS